MSIERGNFLMIEKISKKILSFVAVYVSMDDDTAEVYQYGIEISLSTALNIVITMIIAFAFGSPLCGIIFLTCMILIRSYSGGYHAESYFKCNCTMIMAFSIAFFTSKFLFHFNLTEFHIMASALMLAFIPIYAFSPVKNEHKPLSESKAKKCRMVSIILFIFTSLVGLFLVTIGSLYGSMIIITLIEVSVMILLEIHQQRREHNEAQRNDS